eukprot:scaffold1077_cov253-Pinguiococcus_pyrenoidosus.AAC.3
MTTYPKNLAVVGVNCRRRGGQRRDALERETRRIDHGAHLRAAAELLDCPASQEQSKSSRSAEVRQPGSQSPMECAPRHA